MRPGPSQLWPEVAPKWILDLPQWLEDLCYDVYKCFIFDDRRFQEYRIEILWQFDDSQLKRMGIAKSYNTQFQKFDLDDKKLVIESNNRYIILECVNYDD